MRSPQNKNRTNETINTKNKDGCGVGAFESLETDSKGLPPALECPPPPEARIGGSRAAYKEARAV